MFVRACGRKSFESSNIEQVSSTSRKRIVRFFVFDIGNILDTHRNRSRRSTTRELIVVRSLLLFQKSSTLYRESPSFSPNRDANRRLPRVLIKSGSRCHGQNVKMSKVMSLGGAAFSGKGDASTPPPVSQFGFVRFRSISFGSVRLRSTRFGFVRLRPASFGFVPRTKLRTIEPSIDSRHFCPVRNSCSSTSTARGGLNANSKRSGREKRGEERLRSKEIRTRIVATDGPLTSFEASVTKEDLSLASKFALAKLHPTPANRTRREVDTYLGFSLETFDRKGELSSDDSIRVTCVE